MHDLTAANLDVLVPTNPNLIGLVFYLQAWVEDPKATPLGVATSNAVRLVVGG